MKNIFLTFFILLSCLAPAMAQRVDFDKKSGLITVDSRPSFYLTGTNRVLFQSDYLLENLQHQELAYLRVMQQRIFSPMYGYTTETFYIMTFAGSGNYCEIHGLTGFSMFKALARYIAAARLVENNTISMQAERRFMVMNNGVFRRRPHDRRDDNRYDNRRDRNDDRDRFDNRNAGRDDGRNDNRYNRHDEEERRDDNRYNNDRSGESRRDEPNDTAPQLPPKVSISNGKIYDNNELIGTYIQEDGGAKGSFTIIINDPEDHKVGTARRINNKAEWQITINDGTTFSLKYDKESPLIGLFTSLVERQYL